MPIVRPFARLLGSFVALAFGLSLAACGGGGGGGSSAAAVSWDFVHVTTAENSSGSVSRLDHPRLNGNPDMIVIATSVANHRGGFPRYFPGGPLRTEYDPATGEWSLIDLSYSSGLNYAYNISIFQPGPNAFRHAAVGANIQGNSTALTNALLDGQPDARVLITMHREVGSTSIGRSVDRHMGVWYSSTANTWRIFAQDRSAMTPDTGFSVVVLPAAFPHYDAHADGGGAGPYPDQINLIAPWLENADGEIVHVTPIWGEPGTPRPGVYVDSLPVLVRTSTTWAVSVNLPLGAGMPAGARYTVARVIR